MAEYIKRTDAVKIAEKYGLTNGSVLGRHTGLADCIARDISGLPAANVAPVRHGRWIKESDGGTRCSVCNKQVRDVTGGGDEPVDLSDMPYCPKCGAKMDLEE